MKSNSVVSDPPIYAIQSIGNHYTGPEIPLQKDHGSTLSYFTAFITYVYFAFPIQRKGLNLYWK